MSQRKSSKELLKPSRSSTVAMDKFGDAFSDLEGDSDYVEPGTLQTRTDATPIRNFRSSIPTRSSTAKKKKRKGSSSRDVQGRAPNTTGIRKKTRSSSSRVSTGDVSRGKRKQRVVGQSSSHLSIVNIEMNTTSDKEQETTRRQPNRHEGTSKNTREGTSKKNKKASSSRMNKNRQKAGFIDYNLGILNQFCPVIVLPRKDYSEEITITCFEMKEKDIGIDGRICPIFSYRNKQFTVYRELVNEVLDRIESKNCIDDVMVVEKKNDENGSCKSFVYQKDVGGFWYGCLSELCSTEILEGTAKVDVAGMHPKKFNLKKYISSQELL